MRPRPEVVGLGAGQRLPVPPVGVVHPVMALEDVRVVAGADAALGIPGKCLIEVAESSVVVVDLAVALTDAEVSLRRVALVEQPLVELDRDVVDVVLTELIGCREYLARRMLTKGAKDAVEVLALGERQQIVRRWAGLSGHVGSRGPGAARCRLDHVPREADVDEDISGGRVSRSSARPRPRQLALTARSDHAAAGGTNPRTPAAATGRTR